MGKTSADSSFYHQRSPACDRCSRELADLEIALSPFDENIVVEGEPIWVKPELTATVKFTYWTRNGYMREPVLVRIQD